jgi:hypothetical protein
MARKPPKTRHPIAAIVTLDPAGVGPSGVAVRLTSTLDSVTVLNLRYPDYVYQGPVFNNVFLDELTAYLMANVPADKKVLLVVEDSVYRSYTVARHIGRGIGCIQNTLMATNMLVDPADSLYVTPSMWRSVLTTHIRKQGGTGLPKGRDNLKAAAVEYVAARYKQDVESDLAEAVVMNDYIVHARKNEWAEAPVYEAAPEVTP